MWAEIEAELRKEQERVLEIAETCAERFWTEHLKHRGNKRERGKLGIRVRRMKVGVAAHWFTAAFFKTGKGGNAVTHNYIPLNGKLRYTQRMLTGLKPWERALALELEEELAYVRAQSDALVRISKIAKAMDKRRTDREMTRGGRSRDDE